MPRRGFTLVELLVVIAIIGLLSTVAMVSLNSARIQSRNAKRVADVRQLVAAFSLGLDASSDGLYPQNTTDQWYCISSSCTGGWAVYPDNATVNSFLQPFAPNKPTDPADSNARGRGGYVYNGAPTAPFSAGPQIAYTLEKPAVCTLGENFGSYTNYIQCQVKLY